MALSRFGWTITSFTILGTAAFFFGIQAENRMPIEEAVQDDKSAFISHHLKDQSSVTLGSFSVVLLLFSKAIAMVSLFYPFNGKSIPRSALWKSKLFTTFFTLASILFCMAQTLMLKNIVNQSRHIKFYDRPAYRESYPSAKTGLFSGAAYLAFDTTLFWLICTMLATNARADYFMEREDVKGYYGKVEGEDNNSTITPSNMPPADV